MKFLAILLITWIDGSQSGYNVPTDMICGDLMDQAITLANENEMRYSVMRCIYTDQIVVSPFPPKRPVG
jgi:hypothetical protein